MAYNSIVMKIKRQKDAKSASYWEEFKMPYVPNSNIISCLMTIQRNPVNTKGEKVTAPAWEAACLEEVCGTCTMVINGTARQACATLIDSAGKPQGDTLYVTVEPMTKFPVIRDLVVDRSYMFETLKRLKAWIPIDGIHDLGPAVRMSPSQAELRYDFSRCMTCGCCVESCPNVSNNSNFIGPTALGQAFLFNHHPVGKELEDDRYDVLAGPDGLLGCGNAQNCIEACPKEISLTRAIAELNRGILWNRMKKVFVAKDKMH